ncbi:MAG: serine/threonine-protein kinase [Krumholzibacteria bacterium]|nr:serine/threonine-protein kinase [Candidatus Krumholzibacteria bacterium]
MIGKSLAHYEIIDLLGKGGMGEVYRARDTKLKRDVALKILPHQVSGDRERAARFEREAHTLASLQHANIASIYGYEEVEGVRFLAMELVEGEDLAQRLKRAPLSVDEALRIGLQVAIGLEAAHERNIVHRDLKPANVKVDPQGAVKILDFGLARAVSGESDSPGDPALSPTITAAMTHAGMILGTAAYMSPEQARGKSIDKRSDIWSFGVMLYEMLTRAQLYSGETVTDILGAIVHGRPHLDALPKDVPPAVQTLLRRCLTPDVHERLRDIGEARVVLGRPYDVPAGDNAPAATKSNRSLIVVSLVLLATAGALGAKLLLTQKPPAPIVQASIALPPQHTLLTTGPRGGALRVSPDGRALAFVAQKDGKRQIWVRQVDQRDAYAVQGTEGGHRPFWSPDGRSLAFFVEGALRRVAVSGGASLTIAAAPDGRGGVWLPSGEIVFAPSPGSALVAVPAGGGQPRQVTQMGLRSHREPRGLPLPGRFLFLEDRGGGVWFACVGNVDGSAPVEIVGTGGGVEYADGRLLYLKGRTLVAQPFDLNALKLGGDPTPLAENVIRDSSYGIGAFSVSESGVLCYQSGTGAGAQLAWFDRAGTETATQGARADFTEATLSHDGTTIAAVLDDLNGRSDIWLIDVARDTRQRFTFTSDDASKRRSEVHWAPDGSFLVFSVEDEDGNGIYSKRTDGSVGETLLLKETGINLWPYDVSSDGKWLLIGREDEASNEDLWVLPLTGDGEARPVFETPFDEWPCAMSPDGRWIAVDSDETGRREVYVIPFPAGGGRWQVSRAGGRFPRWNATGTELFFADPEGSIQVVQVEAKDSVFRTGDPQRLFEANLAQSSYNEFDYDRVNDRFLILKRTVLDAPIALYLNWRDALEVR